MYIVCVCVCTVFRMCRSVLVCVLKCFVMGVGGCVVVCVAGCRSVCCSMCCKVCCSVCCSVYCNLCCRMVPCVAAERRRDHHLALQQPDAVCCSVVPRVAVYCLQPLHNVPCAVAADTRPPASRCLTPPAPTSTTALCPCSAAM